MYIAYLRLQLETNQTYTLKPCYLGSTNGRKGHLGSATLPLNSESDETAELPSLLNQVATMRNQVNQGNSLEALVVGKGARSTAANNTGSTTVGLADHRKDNFQIATLQLVRAQRMMLPAQWMAKHEPC